VSVYGYVCAILCVFLYLAINNYALNHHHHHYHHYHLSSIIIDANRLKPLDVQVCIVANKHDLFKSLPSSHRRSTIQVLRFIAHFFGAHLITMSSSSESSVRDSYRALISSFAFSTPIKPAHEVSNTADKLVFVTRGSDSYKSILLDYNVGILDTADIDSKHSKVRHNVVMRHDDDDDDDSDDDDDDDDDDDNNDRAW